MWLAEVLQSSDNKLYHIENSTKGSLEKLTYIEQRMERFMQDGMETCRHICQIVDDFDMHCSGGAVQWPTRRAFEEQMSWSTARARFGELGSVEAWNLVVQGGYKQVQGMVQDHRWTAQCLEERLKEEKMEPHAAKKMKKSVQWHQYQAKRLEPNMQYLKANVELLKGNDECEDLQQEMSRLQNDFLSMKSFKGVGAAEDAAASREFYTSAVAFRSADLMSEVKNPMKAPTPPSEHESEKDEAN